MGMMKRLGLPILEEMGDRGAGTRMELFDRVRESHPDLMWEHFKRMLGWLQADGMVERVLSSNPIEKLVLTAAGEEVVKEFCSDD